MFRCLGAEQQAQGDDLQARDRHPGQERGSGDRHHRAQDGQVSPEGHVQTRRAATSSDVST